jgi:hypothetical protein
MNARHLIESDDFDPKDELMSAPTLSGVLSGLGLSEVQRETFNKHFVGQTQGVYKTECIRYESSPIPLKHTIAADPSGGFPLEPFNSVVLEVVTWFATEISSFQVRAEFFCGNTRVRVMNAEFFNEEHVAPSINKRVNRALTRLRVHNPRTLKGLRKVIQGP